MDGKIVLVTGATAGIGYHIAAALATLGAKVFVTGRNEARGKEAVDELRRLAGHNQIELIVSDASLARENVVLADEVARRVDRLDVLVANAGGGVVGDRRMTREGFELNLALNFIGPFTLTNRLLPLLSKSAPSRIIHVGSSAFEMAKGDAFADLNSDQRYVGIEAHARAKLLALLFVLGLVRKLEGTSILANSVNPGMAWTPSTEAVTSDAVPAWRFIFPIVRWFQKRAPAEKAARGPIFLASSPAAAFSGRYFDEIKEKPLPAHVQDRAIQERAWTLGETLMASALAT